jgi:hypothetical protein
MWSIILKHDFLSAYPFLQSLVSCSCCTPPHLLSFLEWYTLHPVSLLVNSYVTALPLIWFSNIIYSVQDGLVVHCFFQHFKTNNAFYCCSNIGNHTCPPIRSGYGFEFHMVEDRVGSDICPGCSYAPIP